MPTKAEMKVVLTLYKSIQYQRAGNSRDSVKTSWSTFHNVQNEVEEREKKKNTTIKKEKEEKKKNDRKSHRSTFPGQIEWANEMFAYG